MKKLIMFLAGLILVALMFGALFLAGAIYDTGNKATVDTFFFQPNNLFYQRPGDLKSINDLSADQLRDMLLNKYITEYFYVTPDLAELANRMEAKTALKKMSAPKVFAYWLENIVPEIEEMTNQRMLRTASLVSVTPVPGSDKYWRVEYELKTWKKPNNLALSPVVTRGILHMEIVYRQKLKEEINGRPIESYLESGQDPVAVFGFGIQDITTQEE
ncbi:MAG: hypothetical protein J6S12_03965 [Alphaproteobacteria bacterium]|nr:hypothetical protein [Alphaproteobacteria bacterium]